MKKLTKRDSQYIDGENNKLGINFPGRELCKVLTKIHLLDAILILNGYQKTYIPMHLIINPALPFAAHLTCLGRERNRIIRRI